MQVHKWHLDQAQAHLLVVHGYLEHGGRYEEMARFLNQRGISVTAYDQLGHGRSPGPRGYCERFEQYVDDAASMLQSLPEPRFVLGQSFGGLVALALARRTPEALRGLILTNPYLENAVKIPGWKLAAANFLANRLPRFALPSGLTATMLTHDAEMQRRWRQDTLMNKSATAGWFREVREGQKTLLADATLKVPLLLVVGESDPVAVAATSVAFARRLQGAEVTVESLPGQLHEVLNESDRQKLFERIATWITAHAPNG
jgi:alpha-beta hydrolase superfamily lysophospholipase